MVHKHISETIIQLLKMLPELYAGVHLRGTDFLDESEAQAANMLVRKFISGIEEDKIFVATDSSTFLDLIRIERPHNRIYNLSGSLMQERSPIHMIDSKSLPEGLKSKVNLYAILDLALLSFARLVYVPLISHRGYSGFGRLAQFLNVTKQTRASFFGL